MSQIEEPLRTVLEKFCHVECYDSKLLRDAVITGHGFPYDIGQLKVQLRDAIDKKSISPEEYEELTEEDFDTQEDLQIWLEELWLDISAKTNP